jgi:hypothetical protein
MHEHIASKAKTAEDAALWTSAAVLYRMAANKSTGRHRNKYIAAARRCERHYKGNSNG